MTKDEMRVERSIERLEKELIASFERLQPAREKRELEFEKYCIENHLIYSPY